jgi:uncharacterized protein YbjT (DUF2867 family)
MILVVGASGVLGGTTARFLLARGRGVRAMTRRADALGPLRQLGADIVSGELKTGRAQILGPGVRPFNLVAVDDVAAMIALVVDRPEARGADVPVGGPENLTQRAIADTIAPSPGGRRGTVTCRWPCSGRPQCSRRHSIPCSRGRRRWAC